MTMRCANCDKEMTRHEVVYYGHACDACEDAEVAFRALCPGHIHTSRKNKTVIFACLFIIAGCITALARLGSW